MKQNRKKSNLSKEKHLIVLGIFMANYPRTTGGM